MTIYKNKIGKIENLDIKNLEIDENILYNFKEVKNERTGKKLLERTFEEWIIEGNIGDYTEMDSEYECIIRLQSLNINTNNVKYYQYYYGTSNVTGEKNGILP